MKKKIIYGLLFAVAMVTASSSFVSCKDYEGDNYAEFQEKLASLQDAYDKQVQAMRDYVLTSRYDAETGYSAAELAAKGTIKSRLDALEKDTASLADRISKNNEAIAIAQGLAERDSTYLRQLLLGWDKGGSLGDMVTEAAGLLKDLLRDTAHYNFAYDTLSTYYKNWNLCYDTLTTYYKNWNFAYDTLSTYYKEWNRAVIIADSALKIADSALVVADKAWTFLNEGDVTARGQKMNTLQDMANAFDAAVDSLQDQIDDLNLRVDSITKALKKQVTGIIVQGTYSPVFGYGSLPLGVQTNILAAYAGKAVATVQFPSAMKAFDDAAIITEADKSFVEGLGQWPSIVTIESGDMLVDESKGNAGKMYLTVNPTNVDFEGTEFTLVNSKGEESRIQLSGLNASEEVLTFGWKRASKVDAASKNGFYEVEATIKADDAKAMQPEIRKDQFKNAVKKALNGEKRLAVKEAARAIFNSLQPIQRYGVQAEWFDDVKNDYVKYTSAYDVAAFSLNPLGFGFHVPATKYTRVPLIDINYLKEQLHINANINQIDINAKKDADGKIWLKVEVPVKETTIDFSLINDDGKYAGYTTTYKVYDDNSSTWKEVVVVDARKLLQDMIKQGDNVKAEIDVTDMYEEIYGQFNTAMGELNSVLSQVNSRIDFILNYVEKYNYYADKVNSLINRVGLLVQPALLWVDAQNNVGELGGVIRGNKAIGTVVPKGAKIALVPTSYSLELFAPAYKKSLIVTNAYKNNKSAQNGDATLKTAVQNLNKDLKADGFDLYSGTSLQKQFIFDASKYESGITFEIAYTAVDYEGQIGGRKCYITVGE